MYAIPLPSPPSPPVTPPPSEPRKKARSIMASDSA